MDKFKNNNTTQRPTFKDSKEFYEKYIKGYMTHYLMEKNFSFTKDINLFQYRLGIYSTLEMYMDSISFELLNEYLYQIYKSELSIIDAFEFMDNLENNNDNIFKEKFFEPDGKTLKDEYKRLRMYCRFLSFLVCKSYDEKLEKKIIKEYYKWLETYQ